MVNGSRRKNIRLKSKKNIETGNGPGGTNGVEGDEILSRIKSQRRKRQLTR